MLIQGRRGGDQSVLLASSTDDGAAALRGHPALTDAGAASVRNPRAWAALRAAQRAQSVRFCVVGLLGTAVNLAVFAALVAVADASPQLAAVVAFCVAVTHNHLLHRVWTFERRDAAYLPQGARFLVVSLAALGVNLVVLHGLLVAGSGELEAQALGIAAATPASFVGNRVWAFRAAPSWR
jgi:dolichol-phosphate mannosyltransferase